MTTDESLLYSVAAHVATISINRPARCNALDRATIDSSREGGRPGPC